MLVSSRTKARPPSPLTATSGREGRKTCDQLGYEPASQTLFSVCKPPCLRYLHKKRRMVVSGARNVSSSSPEAFRVQSCLIPSLCPFLSLESERKDHVPIVAAAQRSSSTCLGTKSATVAAAPLTRSDEVEGQRKSCVARVELAIFSRASRADQEQPVSSLGGSFQPRNRLECDGKILTRLSAIPREEIALWLPPHPPGNSRAQNPARRTR